MHLYILQPLNDTISPFQLTCSISIQIFNAFGMVCVSSNDFGVYIYIYIYICLVSFFIGNPNIPFFVVLS